jgi:hypothetical protein
MVGPRRNKRTVVSSTLILLIGLVLPVVVADTANAYSINANTSTVLSTGGGGGAGSAACATGSVLYGIYASDPSFDNSYALSQVYGMCTPLNSAGTQITAVESDVGNFGSTTGTQSKTTCGGAGTVQAIVGAVVYKTNGGYASGIKLICATLPDMQSASRTTQSSVFGSTGVGTNETIYCPNNNVATGIYVYYGGIEDKFGLECGSISGATQSTITLSLSTSTNAYPYSQAPGMSTTGGNGSGSTTYTVAGGTASGCALNSNASNAVLTATSTGTCIITATNAGDSWWASASGTATYTFTQASQSITFNALTNQAIANATYTVSASASSGLAVTFTSATLGTCSASGSIISFLTNGTCTVSANQAGNANYLAAPQVQQSFQITTSPEGITVSWSGTNFQFQHTGNLILRASLTGSDGAVTFYYNNKKIFHCVSLSSSSLVATCAWKPTAHGYTTLTASVAPTNSGYTATTSAPIYMMIGSRSVARGT